MKRDTRDDVPCIDACVLSLDSDGSLRCFRLDDLSKREEGRESIRAQHNYSRESGRPTRGRAHIVIIAMRAVLVALFINGHVFAEGLLALLTDECHVHRPHKRMRLHLGVTFGAVVPLLATRGTDGDLGV